jgi:hypothetical protein
MKFFLFGFIIIILSLPVSSFSQTLQRDYENNPQLQKTEIGFSLIIDLTFEEAVDFRPYQILGACNPPLALKALEAEPQIGLMLPCKFIVYVNEDDNTVVSAVDPVKMMEGIENEQLSKVAKNVQEKFIKVLASL